MLLDIFHVFRPSVQLTLRTRRTGEYRFPQHRTPRTCSFTMLFSYKIYAISLHILRLNFDILIQLPQKLHINHALLWMLRTQSTLIKPYWLFQNLAPNFKFFEISDIPIIYNITAYVTQEDRFKYNILGYLISTVLTCFGMNLPFSRNKRLLINAWLRTK